MTGRTLAGKGGSRTRCEGVVIVLSYEEAPEFAGPQSEGNLFGADYGMPGYPSIGRPPTQLDPETMQRERDAAARAYERRCRIESLASTIAISALEAGKVADQIEREIAEAADRASR